MYSPENLLHSIFKIENPSHFWVAYSGGLDSHVLLHSIVSSKPIDLEKLSVIHVNHDLSPNSERWVEHCQQVCKELGVECKVIKVNAKPLDKQSPEAAARDARYEAFLSLIETNDCLITAHHKDDQAETLLLQLFRGAGVKGLSSMPEKKPFGSGCLLRPLLNFSRDELEEYAEENSLKWIDDESNVDVRFDRNYIRHKIFPIIKKRWPGILETLSRSAQNCARANSLIEEMASIDIVFARGREKYILSVEGLLKLSFERRVNVMRFWIGQNGFSLPSEKKLCQLDKDVLHCGEDATPLLDWDGVEIRRYRDELVIMSPLEPHDSSVVLKWDLSDDLLLPAGLGKISVKDVLGIKRSKDSEITIRFRQGGERCQPVGRKTHSLKHLFQEWSIPPWQRDRIPLLYCDDELVAVIGYCVCE